MSWRLARVAASLPPTPRIPGHGKQNKHPCSLTLCLWFCISAFLHDFTTGQLDLWWNTDPQNYSAADSRTEAPNTLCTCRITRRLRLQIFDFRSMPIHRGQIGISWASQGACLGHFGSGHYIAAGWGTVVGSARVPSCSRTVALRQTHVCWSGEEVLEQLRDRGTQAEAEPDSRETLAGALLRLALMNCHEPRGRPTWGRKGDGVVRRCGGG